MRRAIPSSPMSCGYDYAAAAETGRGGVLDAANLVGGLPGSTGSTGRPARRKPDVDPRRSRGLPTPRRVNRNRGPTTRTPDQAALTSQPDRPPSLFAVLCWAAVAAA